MEVQCLRLFVVVDIDQCRLVVNQYRYLRFLCNDTKKRATKRLNRGAKNEKKELMASIKIDLFSVYCHRHIIFVFIVLSSENVIHGALLPNEVIRLSIMSQFQ